MGWSSGGYIFNPVAKKMQELGIAAEECRKILSVLIAALQEGDWDTEEESLHEFREDPAIVEAFAENDISLIDWEDE